MNLWILHCQPKKTFLEAITCCSCYRMPQNAFFPRTRNLLVSQKTTQRLFPTLHPLSPVSFAIATVVAFVLLRNSRFNFRCYAQREATPTQESARKWRCDLSRLLVRKITRAFTRANQLHSSGTVWESRWTSWAVRPNEPSGLRGRKDLLNRASALVTTCP